MADISQVVFPGLLLGKKFLVDRKIPGKPLTFPGCTRKKNSADGSSDQELFLVLGLIVAVR